ncbi:MAG: 4Fe-4S dicluster-binding protein [Pyrodictiaceae archaeon]
MLPISYPGEASSGKTGIWRTSRPVINYAKCVDCFLCWLYCPESVIEIVKVDDRERVVIDYEYCKGCGICSEVCPVKAIVMVEEG